MRSVNFSSNPRFYGKSMTCCGETLSGLLEDASGKDRMASLTSADDTCRAAKRAEDARSHGVLWSDVSAGDPSGSLKSLEQECLQGRLF